METLIRILPIVLSLVILSGCAALPDHRTDNKYSGDWYYDLTGGYYLNSVSSRCILLVRPSGTTVLAKFFVTDFCMNEEYIAIAGFGMAGFSATEEELECPARKFYLVEISSGTLYGSYKDWDSFQEQCESLEAGDMGRWYSTKDLP